MKKIAVILFNLGGPDNQAAVEPFLLNLFSDPRILQVPGWLRPLLARLIARRRAPIAREIYAKMGGGSPILPNTQAQAAALAQALASLGTVKCFVAMRYWHPRAAEIAKQVAAFGPDEIVLLPLYPQYSTTTTASSVVEFTAALNANVQTAAPVKTVCCYPEQPDFIAALAAATATAYQAAAQHGKPRVLFSAHGLPEKIIKAGDPYQEHCERTARAIVAKIGMPELDWLNCYQSRVGPLQWLEPSTEAEVKRAGQDRVPVVLVPIAFVSEHSETLVELDIEYRHLAETCGVPFYARVPTVGTAPDFIAGLAQLVRAALSRPGAITAPANPCPAQFSACPCKRGI